MGKKNCPQRQRVVQSILMRTIVVLLLITSTLFSSFKQIVFAADSDIGTSFGIANYLPITDKKVADGDIVSFSPSKSYYLANNPYDTAIVGVVTTNPAISLELSNGQQSYPVVSTGNAYVNVTTRNGNIKKGDPITSSPIAGKGMKATETGYIVGAALEDYSNTNKNVVKKIGVTLNVHYFLAKSNVTSSLKDVFNLSLLASYEQPSQVFKYVVAALVLVLSFVFGFFSFARTANKGLEALGRNPLASRMIELGILLNIIVAVIIVLSGLLVAFFVIRL